MKFQGLTTAILRTVCVTGMTSQASGDKTVADPGFGQQVAWPRRIDFKFLAQVAHINTQIVIVLNGIGAPHRKQQVALGQHRIGIGQ